MTPWLGPFYLEAKMEYSFDIEVAKEFGVGEAVIIKNFQFWIMKNKANSKHLHILNIVDKEGSKTVMRTWTYNSVRAMQSLFPFWTEKQVRRILKSLVDQEVLITSNYNKTSYDRTIWYAFKDESIWLNKEIHFPIWANGSSEKGEPIPDNKPVLKPDNKPSKKKYYDGVHLTDKEYNSLVKFVGSKETVDQYIPEYGDWKKYKGKKYKSDVAALRNWHRKGLQYQNSRPREDDWEINNTIGGIE